MSYIEKTKVFFLSLLVMSGMMLTKPRASFAQTVPQHVTKSANDTLWWMTNTGSGHGLRGDAKSGYGVIGISGTSLASLVAAPQATE